jgi:hypothetical protein
MQVILQGSLRHFPPDELLPFLGRGTEARTVDLEGGGQRARIFLAAGRVLWAEGTKQGAPLDVVADVFTWTSGSFTVLDAAVLPENITPVSLTLPALIEEARRRAEAAGAYVDTTLFRVVDDPALQQQVSLTADEFKVLFRISAGKSFKELVSDLGGQRQELAEKLKKLVQLGLVAVVTPEPQAQPDPTAPQKKTVMRRKTLVGSLTPDGAPDNVYPLLDAEYSIGRAPSNSIPIPDGSVSSNHARLLRTNEGFVLEDLQSRNGTFVNGEKVTEKRLLSDGDLIRIGKVIMTFNIAREAKQGETTLPEVRLGS